MGLENQPGQKAQDTRRIAAVFYRIVLSWTNTDRQRALSVQQLLVGAGLLCHIFHIVRYEAIGGRFFCLRLELQTDGIVPFAAIFLVFAYEMLSTEFRI